jgi:hypothetical protein
MTSKDIVEVSRIRETAENNESHRDNLLFLIASHRSNKIRISELSGSEKLLLDTAGIISLPASEKFEIEKRKLSLTTST